MGSGLQSRITLRDDLMSSVIPPEFTLLVRCCRNTHILLNPPALFHGLDEKSCPKMPGNMTMKRPNPWVIGLESNDEMPARWADKNISSRGVRGIDNGPIPCSMALR